MGRKILGGALTVLFAVAATGCRRIEPPRLDPVRALKTGVRPAFQPPADGLLKPADVDLFLKVRGQARSSSEAEAFRATGADQAEFAWVRARLREALLALDADRVAAAASEAYARGLAVLRDARKSARDPKTGARLDVEIATLERERATLRKSHPVAASLARNAALLAPRRAEVEAAGP